MQFVTLEIVKRGNFSEGEYHNKTVIGVKNYA